ncbi:DUF5719 family protein [Streptomonospora sp. S1-112]|uniref:DUF5719 family protein n=1 Tax=Streptomonospora mangrovi TaxID=2883123 RepID=A0A9X3NXJ8_9ACTN|nr:DUF5719 family protein [Streptomonospora mangrovi]MDA0566181.1 DUF5719 family protein [Streptomonospora mangrovi]
MRLIVENRFALLVLVAIALTALFGVAAVTQGVDPGGAEEAATAPVESDLRLCPPPQGEDRATTTAALATGAPGGGESGGDGGEGGEGGEGRLTVAENTAEAAPVGESPFTRTGHVWSADTSGAEAATAVTARGAMAAGLEVAQTTVGEDDPYATEVRCPAPTTSTWFAAPGGTTLEGLRLFLANPDGEPATANVDIYLSDGPSYSDDTRGIAVEGRGHTEVDLTELIQGSPAAVVHVRTNAGRVAASLFAERDGAGEDWVPPTTAPARSHVVPGIPGGGGSRRLIVATVGDTPATADVAVYTPEGRAEHENLTGLGVPPAAGTFLSLEGPLAEQPGTAVVRSDQPVVVGVAMEREDGQDTAYAPAAPPLAGPLNGTAVVPAAPEGTESLLVFAALEEDAAAVVTPVDADGRAGDPVDVEIPAGRTTAPEIEAPEGAGFVVRVSEGAPVYAGRVLTQGSGGDAATSALPLLPAPARIVLPGVEDSLTSVVP